MVRSFLSIIGLELTPNNHREKILSGLGGFVAIAGVIVLTHLLVGPESALPVVTSMGASAVLLFAAPHGSLSQPWPLVAGHVLSAAIGVTAARWIAPPALAGAVAVGLAITAMYYGRCVHPPGGATALTAVLGGAGIRNLGYDYVLVPVGVNVALILVMAVVFNYLFAWRRYPAALAPQLPRRGKISREDWGYALTQVGSLADVTAEELTELHALAVGHLNTRTADRRLARAKRMKRGRRLV